MNWADFKIAVAQGLVASAESVANIISGATKVGNADKLDGYDASDFVMFSNYKQYLDSLKADTDNRNVPMIPDDYNSVFKVVGLKSNEIMGLVGTGTVYSFVVGIRGWSDSTAGDAHELAFCANGKLYHRCGGTGSWNPWNVLMDSNMTVPVIVSTTEPTDKTAVWIVP